MPRSVNAVASRARRKRILKQAKGFYGKRKNVYTVAKNVLEKGLQYRYVGRKLKKREYRSLWIVRINASCRAAGISYSQFIRGLKAAGIDLNRKVLADIALHDEAGFGSLIQAAKAALDEKAENGKAKVEPAAAVQPTVASEDTAPVEHEAAPEPTV